MTRSLSQKWNYIFIYLYISKKYSTFASQMKKILFIFAIAALCAACHQSSPAEQRKQQKHIQDSIALSEQERSLEYYQSQRELLEPQADSLLALFKYEKNEKYQDHGNYVMERGRLRVLVRDDAQVAPVGYLNGKRINLDPYRAPDSPESKQLWEAERKAIESAYNLFVVIADLRELDKRIHRTSLEIEKYQKRLQKN